MTPRDITPAGQRRLRTLNLAAAALHLTQAIAVVILATDFVLPITAAYLAAGTGAEIDNEHVTAAIQQEYRKLGRLLPTPDTDGQCQEIRR